MQLNDHQKCFLFMLILPHILLCLFNNISKCWTDGRILFTFEFLVALVLNFVSIIHLLSHFYFQTPESSPTMRQKEP